MESCVDARFLTLQETLMRSNIVIENMIQTAIANFAVSIDNKITTFDAKVDGLAAQLNTFIAYVKKTYAT